MNKVILTQEQARMFENHKNAVKTLLQKRVCDNCPTSIDSLTIDDVVKAIAYGYEVEPEFNVGDWVVHSNGNVIRQIEKVEHNRVNVTDGENGYVWGISYIRHATPEEIAEEKERRWWKKHGRDVWELREGDILISKTVKYPEFVTYVNGLGVHFLGGNYETWATLKKGYEIVCFAEDRRDLKDHE